MLFGPAYKGIRWPPPPPWPWPATRPCRARATCRSPTTASSDHGEGGTLVGAPLKGKVVIIDDVITAGTSVRESVEIIRAGAEPAAVLIAMDRMERAGPDDALSAHSAVQDVAKTYGIPVVSIASLADILALLQDDAVACRAPRGGAGLSDQVRSEVRRWLAAPSVSAEASGFLP